MQLYGKISAALIDEHMSPTRRIGLICLMSLLGQFAKADVSSEIFEAKRTGCRRSAGSSPGAVARVVE